jgi:hypothetical protein
LQRLLILVVGGVFNDDGIVAFANFAAFLRLGFRLSLRLLLKPWGEGRMEMYFFTSSYDTKQA